MKRGQVMIALAGMPLAARVAASGAARADQRYRIGCLSLGSPALESARFEAFQRGLAALGYVEGGNLDIVTRWLDGRPYALLDEMARELVALEPDAIVTYTTPGV